MASKQNYLPTWTTVTPVKPVEKKTTVTPILPPMVGSKLVAPVLPPVPVKLATPVAPPMSDKLVNVPKQQGRVVNKSVDPVDAIIDALDQSGRIDARDEDQDKLIDAVVNSKNPRIRNMFQQQVDDDPFLDTDIQKRNRIATSVANDIQTGRSYGFSNKVIPSLTREVLYEIENIALNPRQRTHPPYQTKQNKVRMIEKLSDAAQETLASLAPGWSGTFVELVAAAKSLSQD